MDRERISEASFLGQKAFEGAQLKYTWRQLEPVKDGDEFADIQHDVAFLKLNGKKLFIQIQMSRLHQYPSVSRYLLQDPAYYGGADKHMR